jgi:hypothetical protein
VWRIFKQSLDQKRATKHLQQHTIVSNNFEYDFGHAWKNNQWRVLGPVSFDLENAHSIKDKAAKWLGRATVLQSSREKFNLYFLLGKPTREELLQAYTKAENIPNEIPVEKIFVGENEAESFANNVSMKLSGMRAKPEPLLLYIWVCIYNASMT